MVSLSWSETSKNDLKNIYDYISRDSEFYAKTFVQKIQEEVNTLKTHKKLGRIIPEYNLEELRELIFQNYRIIYKLEDTKIFIVTIFHSARDLSKYKISKSEY